MKSGDLFAKAQTLMPGGVSSPVRAIKPYPFYTAHAEGAHITTVDGATLVDCCMAYGPLLLGHAHPEIKKAIAAQPGKGLALWHADTCTNRKLPGWSPGITRAWT